MIEGQDDDREWSWALAKNRTRQRNLFLRNCSQLSYSSESCCQSRMFVISTECGAPLNFYVKLRWTIMRFYYFRYLNHFAFLLNLERYLPCVLTSFGTEH